MRGQRQRGRRHHAVRGVLCFSLPARRTSARNIVPHEPDSLTTRVEVLEHVYPVRVHRYAVRRASGGRGSFRGGDGIIREIELLSGAQVAVLSDRRKIPPYGLSGGSPGAVGKTEIIAGGRVKRLPSKCSLYTPAGTIVRIETPGGGG